MNYDMKWERKEKVEFPRHEGPSLVRTWPHLTPFHLPNPSISLHTSLDFQEILHGEEKGIIDSERRDRPGRSELERKERDEPRDDSPFHSLLFFPSYGLFIMFLFHILAVHSLPKTSEARRDRGGKEGQMKDREMIKLQNAESRWKKKHLIVFLFSFLYFHGFVSEVMA